MPGKLLTPQSLGSSKNPESYLSSQLDPGLDGDRIEREIGTAGMATVYLGEDLRHEPKVALTVLDL